MKDICGAYAFVSLTLLESVYFKINVNNSEDGKQKLVLMPGSQE